MLPLIELNELSVSIDNQEIVKDLSLKIMQGHVHALMGPHGSGKSTLAYALLGHPKCNVTKGAIYFNGQDVTDLEVEKRAKLGMFLAFQFPHGVQGLQIFAYLKEIYCAFTGAIISYNDFKLLLEQKMKLLDIEFSFAYKSLDDDFTNLQKKKIEMLQLLLVNPKVAIVDEIDCGLDIEVLKVVSDALWILKKINPEIAIILVTHYQPILSYIVPDFVHIINHGSIIKTGDNSLATYINNGYGAMPVKEYL